MPTPASRSSLRLYFACRLSLSLRVALRVMQLSCTEVCMCGVCAVMRTWRCTGATR